mmetsp:Transcript_30079/g.59548  ORF Transcript_30079/g.59548 Transcript_30079/m.59548 type:complete len:91 (+) Transcript_30079:263-535(+)
MAAGDAMFLIPGGLGIGSKNAACEYGLTVLSVDTDGTNCPSGLGSVTFGQGNAASGKYAAVTGGEGNTATSAWAVVTGDSQFSAAGGHTR